MDIEPRNTQIKNDDRDVDPNNMIQIKNKNTSEKNEVESTKFNNSENSLVTDKETNALNSHETSMPDQNPPKTFFATKTHFNGVEISKLTKNQNKKYKKYLEWAEKKAKKRAAEREKSKEKKKFAKLNNIDLGPSRKELKKKKMAYSSCGVSVCIDLSFVHLMIDKDMAKTIKQILRVYTENRRAKAPLQLHLSSFNGRSKEEMARHHGYENWDIKFHESHYLDIFSKEQLVYLTSESDNIIEKLEDNKVYIIGGLVDHNKHKGLCYNQAVKEGISHGQLPIGEYFRLKHRKVLTINQVFEILVRVTEGNSFKDALDAVLPKRIPKVCVKPKEEKGFKEEQTLADIEEKTNEKDVHDENEMKDIVDSNPVSEDRIIESDVRNNTTNVKSGGYSECNLDTDLKNSDIGKEM